MEENNKLLDMKQVGDILGIKRESTRLLFRQEDFPRIKIGKRYLVFQDDFYNFLREHRSCDIYLN